MKKILILTIDAGFGHRRAAEAIEEAFHVSYPDECEVEIVNPMDNPNTPDIVRTLETGYDEMVTDDPRLYQIAYSATDAPMVAGLIQRAMIAVLSDAMEHLVEEHQPDAMILTHPVYIEAAVKACQKADLTTPVNTVVTDLIGVHSLWFHKKADLTFVPTGQVMKQAISQGLATSQVQLSGLPVQPAIALEERSKAEIRESLGWEQEITTALIVGSARARRTAAIAHLLDRSGLPLQIAAVAGGDKRSEEELRSTTWKGIVHPYGFVTNMVEMMHAADFIVCKAGGLIVTESLAVGLPLILYEALPGQEVGNVRYVVDSGAGAWSPGTIGVLTTAFNWLTNDQSELIKRRKAAKRVGKPRAALDIADRVIRQLRD